MYSVRAQIDENIPIEKEPYRLPKDFASYLSQSLSSKDMQKEYLEIVMVRLARISYDSFDVAHVDDELKEMADKIQNRYFEEISVAKAEFRYTYNNMLPDDLIEMSFLISMNCNEVVVTLRQLLHEKYSERAMIRDILKKNGSTYYESFPILSISIKEIYTIVKNRKKIKDDVKKYCRLLTKFEIDTFCINKKDKINPFLIVAGLSGIDRKFVYKYLAKRKILFIDAGQMKQTLMALNIEYSKLCDDGSGYFPMSITTPQQFIIQDRARYESDLTEPKKTGRDALFSILKDSYVGDIIRDNFYIQKAKGNSSGIHTSSSAIHRTVCFAAKIIYDYQEYIGDPITQKDLVSGIYSVLPSVWNKYKVNEISIEEIIKKVLHKSESPIIEHNIKPFALGERGKPSKLEMVYRRNIISVIRKKYPEYLEAKDYYPLKISFYKEIVEPLLLNDIP